MATKEKQSIETDIALIKQEQKNQSATLGRIEKTIENFSFVSQKDYDKDMLGENGVMARLRNLENYNSRNSIGATFANILSSKALTIVAGGMIAAALYAVIYLK